jgi:hypothetical protein
MVFDMMSIVHYRSVAMTRLHCRAAWFLPYSSELCNRNSPQPPISRGTHPPMGEPALPARATDPRVRGHSTQIIKTQPANSNPNLSLFHPASLHQSSIPFTRNSIINTSSKHHCQSEAPEAQRGSQTSSQHQSTGVKPDFFSNSPSENRYRYNGSSSAADA